MKFIHCADVHLDTPLQGLAQYEGAPVNEMRNATRRAFMKIVDAALAEQISFLIIAGDLYDVGLKSFETALFFNKQMSRLAAAGIDVYLLYGNHDAASKLIKQLRPPKERSNISCYGAADFSCRSASRSTARSKLRDSGHSRRLGDKLSFADRKLLQYWSTAYKSFWDFRTCKLCAVLL